MIINSLWIGPKLSPLEETCIKSHLKVGHEYHLWTYDKIENIPDGVVIRDGREILPDSEIFVYQVGPGKGSVSAFSNFFRYKLILEQGGWWCDTDVAAVKHWEIVVSLIVASEHSKTRVGNLPFHPTTCVFHAPPQCDLMQFCWEECQKVDKKKLGWGTIGPSLMARAVQATDCEQYVVRPRYFCPVHWSNFKLLIQNSCIAGYPWVYGIHFWNEMWRRDGIDKFNTSWHKDSVLSQISHDVLRETTVCRILQTGEQVSEPAVCRFI